MEYSTLDSVRKRTTAVGRWVPVVFYSLIVVTWFATGVRAEAYGRLWLVLLTLPVLGLYLRNTGKRP